MTLHATAKEFVPSASAKEFVPSTVSFPLLHLYVSLRFHDAPVT